MDLTQDNRLTTILLEWMESRKSDGIDEDSIKEWFDNSSSKYPWNYCRELLSDLEKSGDVVPEVKTFNTEIFSFRPNYKSLKYYKITDQGVRTLDTLRGPHDPTIEKAHRKLFLEKVYTMSRGNRDIFFKRYQIGNPLGFSPPETWRIIEHLRHEKLIRFDVVTDSLSIDNEGVKEMEGTNRDGRGSDVVSQGYSIQVTGDNNVIQQAGANSNQQIQIGPEKYPEMLRIVDEIQRSIDEIELDSDDLDDLRAEVETIRAQLNARRPRSEIVTSCWTTIKGLLVNAGGAIAAGIVTKMMGVG